MIDMSKIKFSEIKTEISNALEEKFKKNPIPENPKLVLINGFVSLPVYQDFSSTEVMLGGPSIPLIGVIGMNTGQVYTFPLKAILPNISLE